MSMKSQQANMKRLAELLSQDLGNIYGARECGPNGAKAEFHSKGKAFLRAMAKDLGFSEFKVNSNPAGIAVSGEVSLYGMWSDGNGLMIQLSEGWNGQEVVLYRTIKHLKDYSGGHNRRMHCDHLATWDYADLLSFFGNYKLDGAYGRAA